MYNIQIIFLYNLTCNANICYNEKCKRRNITSQIFQTSPAAKFTETKAQNIHIKDEIKFLYTKKKNLNQPFYNLHL
jgi:hypothetical protein